jgi:competence protein ComEC
VSPYLWSRGIKKIDVVALTNATADNLGGIKAILENFRVGELWYVPETETPEYATLLVTVAKHGIQTRTLMEGDEFPLSKASVHMIGPDSASGINESLAMQIKVDRMGFLLAEDEDGNAQRRLVTFGETLESPMLWGVYQRVNELTNPGFPMRVDPIVRIIGSGSLSQVREDLPKPESLAIRQTSGPLVIHTDIEGATTLEWKDESLVVRTYRNPQGIIIPKEARMPTSGGNNMAGRQ